MIPAHKSPQHAREAAHPRPAPNQSPASPLILHHGRRCPVARAVQPHHRNPAAGVLNLAYGSSQRHRTRSQPLHQNVRARKGRCRRCSLATASVRGVRYGKGLNNEALCGCSFNLREKQNLRKDAEEAPRSVTENVSQRLCDWDSSGAISKRAADSRG